MMLVTASTILPAISRRTAGSAGDRLAAGSMRSSRGMCQPNGVRTGPDAICPGCSSTTGRANSRTIRS
mgnify:CR=1 FL=1